MFFEMFSPPIDWESFCAQCASNSSWSEEHVRDGVVILLITGHDDGKYEDYIDVRLDVDV